MSGRNELHAHMDVAHPKGAEYAKGWPIDIYFRYQESAEVC